MKKLIYTIVLFLAVSVCSCEDNNTEVEFPVTLYASKITNVSNVRLFTNKTEITDRETILKFIENAECFNLPSNIDIEKSDEVLIFHSKDSLSFGMAQYGFSARKSGNQFLFYSPRTVWYNDRNIVHPILKYTDDIETLPPTIGYYGITREVRVGYGSYTNIDICFLAYKRVKNTSEWIWGTSLNEFNEIVVNSLQIEDTVAVQEYRVKFIAK